MSEIKVGTDLYVHTHLMDAEEIATAMHLHLGKEVSASIYDRRAVKRRRIVLAAIGGRNVAFWYAKQRFVMDLEDVFGNECTHVHN